jgi:hypothetical protein
MKYRCGAQGESSGVGEEIVKGRIFGKNVVRD